MLLLCFLFSHLGTLSSFVSPLISRCLAAVALPVQADVKVNLYLDRLLILVLGKDVIVFDSRNP